MTGALLLGLLLCCGQCGCLTPIGPGPGPGPTPDGKAPFPANGLHVLLVYETKDATKLTADQREILFGAPMREFLKQTAGPDAFRIYDADLDTAADAEVWQRAMAVQRQSLPWVAVSNGKTGASVPLTMTAAEFKALVQKHK